MKIELRVIVVTYYIVQYDHSTIFTLWLVCPNLLLLIKFSFHQAIKGEKGSIGLTGPKGNSGESGSPGVRGVAGNIFISEVLPVLLPEFFLTLN